MRRGGSGDCGSLELLGECGEREGWDVVRETWGMW